MTLKEFFALYLANHADILTRSTDDFQKNYRLYLSQWGELELADIKRLDVIKLKTELFNAKGKSAANKAVELLSMLFNKAIDWEVYEGKNPAARVGKFKIQARDRYLHPDEVSRFFAAVNELKNPTVRDYFFMLLFTGQRRRNVGEMRWQDLDTSSGVWRIPMTKNGTAHSVPLPDEALAILQRRISDPSRHPVWVFPKLNGSGPLWCTNTAWKAVITRAGLPGLRRHDLRRTLASWQAAAGVSLPVIGRTLNHRDIKSTMVYAHLDLTPVRKAIGDAVKEITRTAG